MNESMQRKSTSDELTIGRDCRRCVVSVWILTAVLVAIVVWGGVKPTVPSLVLDVREWKCADGTVNPPALCTRWERRP